MSEEQQNIMADCLYSAYQRATKYMAEHEDCMSAAYTSYENNSIKVEVRIKRIGKHGR